MYSNEIQNSKILQWSLGSLIFVYFIVFYAWASSTDVTLEAIRLFKYVCPPYFQSCESLYFLNALPISYSQTIFYMCLFGILVWSIYLMSEKAWALVQTSLIPIFIWHTANTLLLSDFRSGNYEYYVIAFGLILLFLPYKEFFLKLTLVFFYVLSTFAKIHPSWIEGGYFTALKTGLPFFPYWSIPLVTNAVILMEMVASWFLLSRNRVLQISAFSLFVLFHLYSGILVEYRYPATVLPFLLILFGPWYRYTPVPLTRKSLWGWSFIILLVTLQLTPQLIYGDEKLTMEGNKYGLYMFDANHQCFSKATIHLYEGSDIEIKDKSINARHRCSAYQYWFPLKQMCLKDKNVKFIKWEFNHSINGGPFYRIVETENVCDLNFDAFTHNDWILTEDTAEIVGYPVKNIYR